MTPLQYFRWRLGTYRAAVGTLRHIEESGVEPRALVDAGARNSEFMRVVAKRWRKAAVSSFEPDRRFCPVGYVYRERLGSGSPSRRLDYYSVPKPALLKVDCDRDTVDVLRGANLKDFEWVVVEVSEDGNGSPNNRSEIETLMRGAGFDRSKVVDAVVCYRTHRVSQTDVLYWRLK
jgi:hypothetical protein